jgi:4-amino-4-deoxy-L-arabinose transferase-like glycosyltransferase
MDRVATGPVRSAWFWVGVSALVGCVSVAFMAVWRDALMAPYDPRVVAIAREFFARGEFFAVPTFSGMAFLEKPFLAYGLIAKSFQLAGGPNIIAARLVIAVLAVVWLVAAYGTTRLVAGPRTAVLATCLLATSNLFRSLANRISIDGGLAACLAISTYFLCRALSNPDKKIRWEPWVLAVLAAGLAFMAKGLFGTFLFVAPLIAYSLWYRDRRVLKRLFHPVSLLLLLAPVALWGWMLYRTGGMTYFAEAFLNNSLGRFASFRFEAADIAALPYGDVGDVGKDNEPWDWWFYITRLGSLAGPALLVLPFVLARFGRRDAIRAGPRARLVGLCLCQALTPLLVLSFSGQKGVHHLGSVSTAFALAGALWLDARLPKHERSGGLSRMALIALMTLAPLALAASLLGLLDLYTHIVVAFVMVVALLLVAGVLLIRERRWKGLIAGFLVSIMTVTILASSRGRYEDEDLQLLDYPEHVTAFVGETPMGFFGAGESALAIFSWAGERDITWIRNWEALTEYLLADGPRVVVLRQRKLDNMPEELASCSVIDRSEEGSKAFVVLGNPGAVAQLTSGAASTTQPAR